VILRSILLWSVCASGLLAQPFLFYRGVFNAASYVPAGLPHGPIARGSIFTLFGRALGPEQGVQVSSFPLGTTLAGVSIDVCQQSACIPAIPVFVQQGQVNAIMPSTAPLGAVSLRVTFNGQAGSFTSATVAAVSPGIFSINSGGYGPAVAQNFLAADNQPINSAAAPAKPGGILVLWATGLGAGLNADNVAPQADDLPAALEIWVGGKPVTVKRYQGRAPCCSGLDQIVFDLPPDTPAGCYVPIQIRANGAALSNSATIAVSADGSPCTDPFNAISERFRQGGRLGLVSATRTNTLFNFIEEDAEATTDFANATFRAIAASPYYFDPTISLPPLGACTVHTARGDVLAGDALPGSRSSTGELDAGADVRFATVAITRPETGAPYSGKLASSPQGPDLPTSLLGAALNVQGAGGADIGAFQLQLQPPASITLTARAGLAIVDRNAPLEVRWQGGDPARDVVIITGVAVNLPENASTQFVCTSDPSTGVFTVPAYILQALPVTRNPQFAANAFGYVTVGRSPLRAPQTFDAAGAAAALAITSHWSSRAVVFR
jgi:uncharacterized protein (TIGR03437 family)